MSDSANVRSLDALRKLRVALLRFETEARRSSSALVVEAQRVLQWLQLEQPQYWKRQVEIAYQQLAESRASLMKCRMRRTGDFKPTCYDEQKAVQRCKQRLELCRKMVDIIKSWTIKSAHEFDEYTSRSAQMTRLLDGDIPRSVAVLERMLHSLEKYSDLTSQASLDDLYAEAADDNSENSDIAGDTQSTAVANTELSKKTKTNTQAKADVADNQNTEDTES